MIKVKKTNSTIAGHFSPPTSGSKIPWWIEVQTRIPYCIYYFGPFNSASEAIINQSGYIEDLREEKAEGITVEIKQYQPSSLTIFEGENGEDS
jgi:hypothetical protein